jgi:hypothetical protein
MEAAHEDDRVQRVTAAFMAAPSDGMLKLLVWTLYGRDARALRSLVLVAGIRNEHHAAAYELGEAAIGIAQEVNDDLRRRCRGAVIEALAERLLRWRVGVVKTEQRVGPFPVGWPEALSNPIDVVGLDGPYEFYECKSVASRIRRDHLVQFGLIVELAAAGPGAVVGFVTLQRAIELIEHLESLGPPTCEIHAYTFEDFLLIRDDRPRRRVA